MKVATEKAFPRGGQKPGVFMPSKGKLELFHKRPGRVKLKSKAKKKEKSEAKLKSKGKGIKVLKQNSAKLLNYKTITEGTLILGCVKEITDFALKVNLPGRIFGEVPINDISNSYTKVLEKLMAGNQMQPSYQLNEMFQVGQYIVTKVMQVKQTEDNDVKVILTSSPKEIHSNWAHRNVETGLVLSAAVSSVEDHGYVMDVGISGVRAFLKMKKARQYEEVWNNGNQLYVGQIVRCLVTKSVSTDTVTTVELSANPEDVAGAEADVSKVTMQTLTPGMLFTATITHIVQSGVQVRFGKNEVGYVHEDHLNEPFSLLKDIAVGSSYPARILYIQPIVKTVYLTLLNDVCPAQPLPSPFEVLNVGDVVDNAKVIRVASQGVLLKLGRGLRGFVSVRHASEELQRDVEKPLIEQLNSLYPSGSRHKCRILGYDYLVQLYSCTLKASVLKDKLFCPDDCKPGSVVSCYINTVKNSGIDVTLGSKARHLVAFVPAMHMADVPLRHPEKKFKEGSKHKARVLQVKNSRIWLTLKPSLVSSTLPPLCNYEKVKRDQPYEGVVILVTAQGLLVEFFNNVKGWVPVHKLSQDFDVDPTKRYYIGQVVKCYVTDVDLTNHKMTLSLVPFARTSSSQVHIGGAFSVEVVSVGPDCLHVQVCNSSERGIIPAQHLTDHPSLSKLLLATYKEGDILSSAYCFSVHDKLVFSVQNSVAQFFQSKLGSSIAAKGVGALKGGEVIPCSVRMVNENGILLNAPIPGLTKAIWVGRKYMGIKEMNPLSLGLDSHQVLMVKLSSVNVETNIFKASTKLSQCWDFNLESAVSLLESYLTDQKRILSHLANQADPLAKYSPGGIVKGVVKSVTEIGAVVELADGIHGVVMPHHYKGLSIKPGKQVEGMVLLLDVVNHCLELTLLTEIMARVNKKQDGVIRGGVGVGMCLRGETMVTKPHQVVVCLKGAGRQQLASVPVRRHLNDFIPLTPLHKLGVVTKIIIQVVGGGIIIGLPKVVIQENERSRYFLEKTKANIKQENSKLAPVKVTDSETDEAYSSDVEASSDLENLAEKVKKLKTDKENSGITNVKDESVTEQQNSESESETETKVNGFNFDAGINEDKIDLDVKSKKYKQKGGSPNVSSNSLLDMDLMHDNDLGIDLREGNKKRSKKTKHKENSMELVSDSEKCLGDVIDLKKESTVDSTKKKGKKSELKYSPEEQLENIQADQLNTSTTESKGGSAKKKSKKSKSKDVPEQHSVEIHETSLAESGFAANEDSALDSSKGRKLKHNISSSGNIVMESDQDSRLNPTVEENISEAKKKKRKKLKRKSISEEGSVSSNCFETSVISLTDTDMNDSTMEPRKKKLKKSGNTNLRAEQLSEEQVNVQRGELEELAVSERTGKEIKSDKMDNAVPEKESHDEKVGSARGKEPLQSISKSEEVNKNSKRRKRTSSSERETDSVTLSEKEKAKKGESEVEIIDRHEVNNVSKPRTLSASIGFVWDAKPNLLPAVARSKADAESSSDDEEDDTNKVKKKKKLTPAERRELARLEEKRLREVEQQLMDSERNPQSADDFDRLVLASPNNSMYWIKYMAFHLQATEIEKARAVADRALKTISFREEQEKLNVWVALLNLENLYGTKESLDKVLQDAVQMNDAFKVYIQMLQIYAESSKIQEADKLIHLLTKKFRDRKDTWLQAGDILMKFKQIDKARALMQKALGALEKKEHVEIIMKFALLENKFGEPERAHTLMEHILTSYPKRVDVWSSYVDMLVKSGSLDIARQVLERAVVQKLPARKMKVLFKKFLQFEEQHGTPEGAEKVRLMALEYVNSATDGEEQNAETG
ncbi:protein RRP5 homolog [Anabrus simplex]|uniref:protein RRP5 homolog n=1 Tax=Anabrus simplex TaxID=316456 RepID=UPI0035A3ABEA